MTEPGPGRRSARSSLRIGAAIAAGTLATWGAALVGLGSLHRLIERDLDNLASLFDDGAGASLEDTEFFSAPAAGYGGQPPLVAAEFLHLLGDREGEEKLALLAARGASGGRLYGLCGLKILGSQRLGADPAAVARRDDRRVALAEGGSLSVTTAAETVRTAKFDDICAGWAQTHRLASQAPSPE